MSVSEHSVVLEVDGDVAILNLGSPEEKVVILSEKRMESLRDALGKIAEMARSGEVKGMVLAGAHEGLFCAGADINIIKGVTSAEEGKRLAKQGQDVFQILEDFPITTVAAISGACVGGGCELVLACDYRILADNSSTKIGLPEVKLGILPGFGGTQRLPRLVGVQAAMDMILKGRVSPASIALKIGLADELVGSGDNLISRCIDIASGKRRPPRSGLGLLDKAIARFAPVRNFVKSKIVKQVGKTTGGHYPAPAKAIESVFHGLEHGLEAGYELEAKSLGELIVTPECKSLVHIYFLTEEASRLGKSAQERVEGTSVGVIGAGTMGAGIAASFLMSGCPVILVDTVKEARERARERIEKIIGKKRSFSQKKKEQCLDSLTLTDDLAKFSGAGLVIEAIIEDLDIKKKVLGSIEKIVGDDCILASNTSSLSVTDIASGLQRPEGFIGMHFFNPAEKMQLVELVCGEKTSDEAIAIVAALTDSLGKYPVVVQDVPGFLVNRTLTPYLVEAAYLLSEGHSVKEIDKAATRFGMPMGPLRLLDEIGLDVAAKVSEIIETGYGVRMQGPKFAEELVAKGLYGKKSGKGFYIYPEGKGKPEVNSELFSMLDIKKSDKKCDSDTISRRLSYSLVNEAVRCLDEGVSGVPGPGAAGQIDLASVMGTGFAPFRGGIINYADSVGAKRLHKDLEEFSKLYGERFNPAKGIKDRAGSGAGFGA